MELKFRPQAFESIEELRKYNQGMGGECFAIEGANPLPQMRPDVATY